VRARISTAGSSSGTLDAAPAGAALDAWLLPAAADEEASVLVGSLHVDLAAALRGASPWVAARDADGGRGFDSTGLVLRRPHA
jgi:hypothetical protein